MDRRQFLINLSVLLGTSVTAISSSAVDAALAFTPLASAAAFNAKQLDAVKTIADIIIPATETPSASSAHAHLYVDHYVANFMAPAEQAQFTHELNALLQASDWFSISASEQLAIVQQLDERIYQTAAPYQFYKQLKHLIVIGYYTSEIGATQALNYDPIPGPYKEMKLNDIGKVWF